MNWNWLPASGEDITEITRVSDEQITTEVDEVFLIDQLEFARQVGVAVINQFYNPNTALLWVAKDQDRIIAYCWASRGEFAPWSRDEMVSIRLVHVDQDLSVKTRIRLITEMIEIWESWARQIGVNIVCSTSMRKNNAGYMAIHQRCGYSIRGSFAYKRLT